MPLTPDIGNEALLVETKHAKTVRDDHLHDYSESIDRYVGQGYSRAQAGRLEDPTNAQFEFIGLFLPEVAGGMPKWPVECEVTGPGEQVADGMTIGLAAHARENRYDTLFQRVGVDFCLKYGIVETFPEVMPDPRNLMGGGPLYAPVSRRVDIERAFWDVTDTSVDYANTAFRGVEKTAVRGSLKAEDGWLVDAIGRIPEFDDGSSTTTKQDSKWSGRDVIMYDCIYVPACTSEMIRELGHSTEEYEEELAAKPYQYNGWMLYRSQTGEDIRKPEPFFGPAMGPYVMFDGYPVPGSTFNASTLTFTKSQQEDLNRAERAMLTAEEEFKSITLVQAEGDTLARKITNTPSGETVAIEQLYTDGGQPLVMPMESGGASPSMNFTLDRRRLSLDRNLGLSDEQKGNSNSGATATASSIAASSGQSRMGWQVGKFYGAAGLVGYINGWYMFHDEQYARSLPETGRKGRFVQYNDEGEIEAVPDPVFVGGIDPEDNYTFDDLAFTFDYISVKHKSADQRRSEAFETVTTIANIAPAMPTMPFVRWKEVWEAFGEGLDNPSIASMFDYRALDKVTGMEMERQAEVVPARHAAGQTQFNLAAPKQRSSDTQQPPQPQPAQGAPIGSAAVTAGT